MDNSIKFFQERKIFETEYTNLKHETLDECINEIREQSTIYPFLCNICGFKLKDKNKYVPNGKEILLTEYESLYDNGYIQDFDMNSFSKKLVKKADELSQAIKEDIEDSYECAEIITVKITRDSYEIVEEKKYEE